MHRPSSAEREEAIRDFVIAFLHRRMQALHITDMDVTEDLNMIDSGLLDSMGFIEMLAAVEERFGVEVDFSARDPSSFTTVVGFTQVVARSKRAGE
jgi:acyl carrier protein